MTSTLRIPEAEVNGVSATPPTVTDEQSARLLAALGPVGMIELTTFIALANFYTRGNIALGVEADGLAASCGLRPLAQPSGGVRAA